MEDIKYSKYIFRLTRISFVIAAVFFIISIYFFENLNESVLLQEKLSEHSFLLNSFANRIKENWDFGYKLSDIKQVDKMLITISEIDEQKETFAEAYLYNGNKFIGLSERTLSYDIPFEPLDYPELMDEIKSNIGNRNESFDTRVWFEGENVSGRWMYVTYRFTPIEEDETYLMVTGISKYSLNNHVPFHIYLISFIRAVLHSLIGIAIQIYLNRLIHVKNEQKVYTLYRSL